MCSGIIVRSSTAVLIWIGVVLAADITARIMNATQPEAY